MWSRPITSEIKEKELNLQNAYGNGFDAIMFPRNTSHDPIGFWYSKFYNKVNPNFGIFDTDELVFNLTSVMENFEFSLNHIEKDSDEM